ncbi:MAG: hypothetical protein ACREQ2_04245 [Candidatus Binatia bacterium]
MHRCENGDKIKTIDDNASDGNHIFNIGIGLTWGGSGGKSKP